MDDIITAIITLLQQNLGAQYKKYFYGEVRVPEQVYFPFIEVIPMTSKITNRGTGGMTNGEYSIMLQIKTSLKKYVGGKKGNEKLDHIQDMVKRIENRNENGTIKSDTVLGVLHDNLKLVISETRRADIVGDWDISYEEADLGESYVVMATIGFTVKRID